MPNIEPDSETHFGQLYFATRGGLLIAVPYRAVDG
jgi:hypothetical protein